MAASVPVFWGCDGQAIVPLIDGYPFRPSRALQHRYHGTHRKYVRDGSAVESDVNEVWIRETRQYCRRLGRIGRQRRGLRPLWLRYLEQLKRRGRV
jgi:hypothetical protein